MLKLKKKYLFLCVVGLLLGLFSIIPSRIAIAAWQSPHPQAILTLGGGPDREQFTAIFAQRHPELDIWVSSGSPVEEAREIFNNAHIPQNRVHLDYRAVDTVTNFTTLVTDLQHQGIRHVYLITSAFHMPRARAIGTIVLGSQGITFTPVSIPTDRPRESMIRIVRDSGRSLLWVVSGRTGASFNPRFRDPYYATR
jgi:uncharacterized SAM-binding protein YcdF (DUF218 family)